MKNLLLIFLFLLSYQALLGANSNVELNYSTNINHTLFEDSIDVSEDSITKEEFNKIKLTAISLAITLGVFGVHRLYLGTTPLVPLAYTLTLGGGFLILPIIDIIYILFAKDLDDIKQNNHVFMWNKKKKSENKKYKNRKDNAKR